MSQGQRKVASDKSPIVTALPVACSDERAAVEFIEAQRWNGEPVCPRCGSLDVGQMVDSATGQRNTRFLWRCHGCKRQFTVRIGTVFEDSRIPLRHWCYAFWAACASKKGVSALQIKRQTGLSYKSALFLMHRIRFAMAEDGPGPMLEGTIEADETYVGGKPRYKGQSKTGRGTRTTPVLALVERGGGVRAHALPSVNAKNIKRVIRQHVHPDSRVITDELAVYRVVLRKGYAGGHRGVKHSAGEYVRNNIHTNTWRASSPCSSEGSTAPSTR